MNCLKEGGRGLLLFDRSGFGNTDLPLWYHLTDFEVETVRKFSGGDVEDPDNLLALAVIASGERRTEEECLRYRRMIRQFIDRIKPEIDHAGSEIEKGRIIHLEMHGRFLAAGSGPDSLGRYNLEQSSFARLLDSGEYNCISSSILYIILARHFGLDVEGVILPTHVFVELTSPAGDIIEIETTSPSGYGLAHDRDFYRSAAGKWAGSRDLSRPTYAEYMNREIIKPYRLILYNMINQHTGNLKPEDRLRLVEIRGYLNIIDSEAVQDRIKLYLMEYNHFVETGDCASSIRMHETIKPDLRRIGTEYEANPEISNTLSFLETSIAYCMAENGSYESSLELIDGAMAKAYPGEPYGDESFANAATVINNIIIYLLEGGQDDRAGELIERYQDLFAREELAREDVIRFYRSSANWCISRSRYEEAADRLNSCLELSGADSIRTADLRTNLLFAYFKWGVDLLKNMEWDQAAIRFERALELSDDKESREKALKNLSIASFNSGLEKGELFIDKYGGSCAGFGWYSGNAAAFYSNIGSYMAKSGRWEKGIAALERAGEFSADGDSALKGKISERISNIYLDWGNDFLERDEWSEAADRFERSLEYGTTETQRESSARNLSLAVFRGADQNGDFNNGEEFIKSHPDLLNYSGYRKNLVWFYSRWANSLLRQEKWPEAISKLKERLRYIDSNDSSEISGTRGYIRDSYINWSFDCLDDNRWKSSLDKLSGAMELADSEEDIKEVDGYIFNAFHKWARFHLQRGEQEKAIDIYRKCAGEHPRLRNKCLIEEERIKRSE